MLKAQIRKLEKLDAPDADQQAELARLHERHESAQAAVTALENGSAISPAKAEADPALKQAKIELAVKRAALKKAEKAGREASELAALRAELEQAEQALHAAEQACGKPAPVLVRTGNPAVDETTRALKTELAFARADLRKLEREASPDAAALLAARQRLAEAERKLTEQVT